MSVIFSICFVSIGFLRRILTSNFPPNAFLPSIRGKESCRMHCVSSGCSFTVTVPTRLSLLKNPLKYRENSSLIIHRLQLHWCEYLARYSQAFRCYSLLVYCMLYLEIIYVNTRGDLVTRCMR